MSEDLERSPERAEVGAPSSEQMIHGAVRDFRYWLTVLATAVIFASIGVFPPAARLTGVGAADTIGVAALILFAVTVATLVYHRAGGTSALYRAADFAESMTIEFGLAYLIFRSHNAVSFFWIVYVVHTITVAAQGISAATLTTVLGCPSALVVAFLASGNPSSALLSLLAGLLGFAVFLPTARVYTELEKARLRESQLRADLAAARVNQERARISRDLHDGIATELTALIWKAREISTALRENQLRSEVDALEQRLARTLTDLRDVVTALRSSRLSFGEAVAMLEQRCRDLCTGLELSFSLRGELRDEEVDPFCSDVLLICFELVNNAAAHSRAKRVDVELAAEEFLVLRVTDDGIGLDGDALGRGSGGLRSVRERVARLGGTSTLQAKQPGAGARVEIALPRPLGSASISPAA